MQLSLVVTPEQVNEAGLARLKIVDLRPLEAFTQSHLPGAIHLDASTLNRVEKPVGGLLPAITDINLMVSTLGLESGDHLLAYDQGAGTAAARLIWVLHAYGFKATSWLNGGFNAWTAANLATSTEVVVPATSNAQLQFTPGNVLSTEQLMAQLYDEDIRVLDVRSAAEFNGTDVRAERGGHIPNAQHSEWTQLFNESGLLKSEDELNNMFETLGIKKDNRVVVYCQTHQRSAVTYVVLKHLGYSQVGAINGAWSAWGNRTDTPIES